jgi:hypothetical protein
MYCPKCGAEGTDTQNYCRKCGVNLALVGKAVSVSEVIARGDSGLLPKIKSVMGNLKLDEVSEQVAEHVEAIGREVERSVREKKDEARRRHGHEWPWGKRTPEERRNKLFEKGFSSFFGGIGFMVLLYVVGHFVQFRIPPEVYLKVPFDLDQAIRLAWLLGLVPALTGLGQVAAAFMIHGTSTAPEVAARPDTAPLLEATSAEALAEPPPSVTEQTTRQLDYENAQRPERRSSRA